MKSFNHLFFYENYKKLAKNFRKKYQHLRIQRIVEKLTEGFLSFSQKEKDCNRGSQEGYP